MILTCRTPLLSTTRISLWELIKNININILIKKVLLVNLKSLHGKGSFEKKKKVKNFLNRVGGSGQTFLIFLTFFIFIFSCSNSCKTAEKIFFIGGVPPSYHQNLENIHNIDQVCGIFQVFQGNFFFFCRKYLLGHQRKKINFGLS